MRRQIWRQGFRASRRPRGTRRHRAGPELALFAVAGFDCERIPRTRGRGDGAEAVDTALLDPQELPVIEPSGDRSTRGGRLARRRARAPTRRSRKRAVGGEEDANSGPCEAIDPGVVATVIAAAQQCTIERRADDQRGEVVRRQARVVELQEPSVRQGRERCREFLQRSFGDSLRKPATEMGESTGLTGQQLADLQRQGL